VRLGAVKDPALANKALALALTDKPGKTTSAAIITAVAREHSEQAFDFFLAHRDAVLDLVDASGRTTYVERLASTANTQAMVDKLTAYEKTIEPGAQKPVERALARIRNRLATDPRITSETTAWLAGQ
jgi:aminopeptidase N